jgi:hypothetical protein
VINPALSPLIGLGIVAIILVVILASFAAGKSIRERALSRTLVEPVLIDVVLSISLIIELRLTNSALALARVECSETPTSRLSRRTTDSTFMPGSVDPGYCAPFRRPGSRR